MRHVALCGACNNLARSLAVTGRVGRCCAAHSSEKCLCCTMHAPCSDRTVTLSSPDHLYAHTRSGRQPNKDLTRTVPAPFQDCFAGPSLCCHHAVTGPCTDHACNHALTMLSPNHARMEPRPCRDHARTMQGPYCHRSFTVP